MLSLPVTQEHSKGKVTNLTLSAQASPPPPFHEASNPIDSKKQSYFTSPHTPDTTVNFDNPSFASPPSSNQDKASEWTRYVVFPILVVAAFVLTMSFIVIDKLSLYGWKKRARRFRLLEGNDVENNGEGERLMGLREKA
ncbi:MAG: hypothetical protein L6R41_004071 [Letrouitia leprolyta]|nr:MAG: hypothetical protein L6R41_004071 [Letrouitia leprolyta]